MKKKASFKVHGMSCTMCANAIEKTLLDIEGILSLNLNFIEEILDLEYDTDIINEEEIKKAVTELRILSC